jgi:hypothetical protein
VGFDLLETHYTAQKAALYATHNSIEEFADKIETLLEDEALRHIMGAFGRKRIEDELCWDCTKVNLWRAYEKLFPSDPHVIATGELEAGEPPATRSSTTTD